MRKSVMTAYAVLESMQVVATSFDAFANGGLGPLGGPAREMAKVGMTGLDFAEITHAWQKWEEELLDLPDAEKDDLVESFLNGGFLPFTDKEADDLSNSLKTALTEYIVSINLSQEAEFDLEEGYYVPSRDLARHMSPEQNKVCKNVLDVALTNFLMNRKTYPPLPSFNATKIDNEITARRLWRSPR